METLPKSLLHVCAVAACFSAVLSPLWRCIGVDIDYNCLPDVTFGLDSYFLAVLQGSSGILLPSQLGFLLKMHFINVS